MFKSLARLFAAPKAASRPNLKTRLAVNGLEMRDTPAVLVGGDDHCGTPWHPPVPNNPYVTRAEVAVASNPVAAKAIIAINPATVRGIIIDSRSFGDPV